MFKSPVKKYIQFQLAKQEVVSAASVPYLQPHTQVHALCWSPRGHLSTATVSQNQHGGHWEYGEAGTLAAGAETSLLSFRKVIPQQVWAQVCGPRCGGGGRGQVWRLRVLEIRQICPMGCWLVTKVLPSMFWPLQRCRVLLCVHRCLVCSWLSHRPLVCPGHYKCA